MRLGKGIAIFAASVLTWGQGPRPPPPGPPQRPPNQGSLKTVALPQFTNASKYIQDQNDNSVAPFPVNQILNSDEFPFHLLVNANDNRSPVVRDRADVTGSQGMFRRMLADIVPGSAVENGSDAADRPAFSVAGRNVRQVTIRNAPTVINAVFNYRNFWDGRASNIFSGLMPYGTSDPGMNALVANNGQLAAELVRVENSSLASQAVGPPANDRRWLTPVGRGLRSARRC